MNQQVVADGCELYSFSWGIPKRTTVGLELSVVSLVVSEVIQGKSMPKHSAGLVGSQATVAQKSIELEFTEQRRTALCTSLILVSEGESGVEHSVQMVRSGSAHIHMVGRSAAGMSIRGRLMDTDFEGTPEILDTLSLFGTGPAAVLGTPWPTWTWTI